MNQPLPIDITRAEYRERVAAIDFLHSDEYAALDVLATYSPDAFNPTYGLSTDLYTTREQVFCSVSSTLSQPGDDDPLVLLTVGVQEIALTLGDALNLAVSLVFAARETAHFEPNLTLVRDTEDGITEW